MKNTKKPESPPPSAARLTVAEVKKTKGYLGRCMFDIERRIESASLGGPARPIIPMGLATAQRRLRLGDSGFFQIAWKWRKFLLQTRSGPKAYLQLLRDRGWENPARHSKQGTGWAPSSGLLRVVARRPAAGEGIFS